MLFSKKKYQSREAVPLRLLVEAQLVDRVSKMRFLRIILDSELTGIEHFKQIVKKGRALINILSSLAAV